jgi:hypothetical protein
MLVLGTVSWLGASRVAVERRTEIGEALGTVLETSHQAIRSWAWEERAVAETWAASPGVIKLTRELLATPRSRQELLRSPAQLEIRSWLRPVIRAKHYRGFFILALDDTNLSSDRDAGIGVPNRLLGNRKDDLLRLWRGEAVISSPQLAEVAAADRSTGPTESQPTMLVGAPVRDETGSVIAALGFYVDPAHDFTAILQRARIGASGETYAFDRQGRLISESRFDHQLRRIGLLGAEQSAILNLEVRDPGQNLLRAGSSSLPRDERPLTRMAESATAGQSSMDLDGYRDYRGVSVIGAWLWDRDLNLGITTELDRSEAYASVDSARTIIGVLTALAIGLIASLIVLFAFWRRLSARLEDALTKVLGGYISICAACKKIPDEAGNWSAVETYVANRTAAEFTHSICPECENALYPEVD